jgi:GNAT superfamily N-acetyltransferase
VRVIQHASAADFLVRTEAFRAADPVLTNIIGSVASSVVAGHVYDAELWLTVHDDAMDEPVGIAMRTAPHNLVASPMQASAARALGAGLGLLDPSLPGVSGTPEVTGAIVDGLGARQRAHPGFLNRVRVLSNLRAPLHPCQGGLRPVATGDLDRVVDWLADFGAEAGLHVQPSRESIRADLLRGGASPLWFWEVAGEPVSLGGHAPLVTTPAGTVARIGPIYTPPIHRGRGYGTAITHAIAGALARECTIVMLYTDAANATSNSIYAQLGFSHVADWIEVRLEPGT